MAKCINCGADWCSEVGKNKDVLCGIWEEKVMDKNCNNCGKSTDCSEIKQCHNNKDWEPIKATKIMNLQEAIEQLTDYADYSAMEAQWSGIVSLLKELQTRRESDIKPCNKYLGNSIGKQLAHIDTEQKEALDELRDYVIFKDVNIEQAEQSRQAALMELTDWQTSIETLKTILEPDEQARRDVQKKVIAKNDERGYYRDDNLEGCLPFGQAGHWGNGK